MRIICLMLSVLHAFHLNNQLSDEIVSKVQFYQETTGISDDEVKKIFSMMMNPRHEIKPSIGINNSFFYNNF